MGTPPRTPPVSNSTLHQPELADNAVVLSHPGLSAAPAMGDN